MQKKQVCRQWFCENDHSLALCDLQGKSCMPLSYAINSHWACEGWIWEGNVERSPRPQSLSHLNKLGMFLLYLKHQNSSYLALVLSMNYIWSKAKKSQHLSFGTNHLRINKASQMEITENLPSYRDDSRWPEPRMFTFVCTEPSLQWLNHLSSPEPGILTCSVWLFC